MPIALQIAAELGVRPPQVQTAIDLLDGGATVPFIARYRKEATGGLDDAQLRELQMRLGYLRELHERRAAILKSIEEQGKLTPDLRAAIEAAPTKQELEDLYLPYKPKRRTKAQIAREFGMEPLADQLWADPTLDPAQAAQPFVKAEKGEGGEDFTTIAAVLDGVRDILAERWAEDAALVQSLREWLWQEGQLQSQLAAGKNEADPEVAKFRDYFDYAEPMSRVPSHRALAVFRGRQLEMLEARLITPLAEDGKASLAEGRIALLLVGRHQGRPADDLLRKCVAWAWRVKLSLSTERDLFARLREEAEKVAIKVFADNLRDLLLAAPAGARAVMGLDPGIRTGVKVAVVDATGKLLETATIYPHEPRRDWDGSIHTLARLIAQHGVQLIAIGNGTASRETDKLAGDLIQYMHKMAASQPGITLPAIEKVVISEAGASVYSASEYASQELPDVDVSLRGAASIARRLQDPLDMTGVHPETYPVVEQIIARTGKPIDQLMGRAEVLKTLKPEQFATPQFGPITVRDILAELEKPGRDPRPGFQVARFNEGVNDIADLKEGMVLEGTVSNVAAFGAFVDLGVHQDGLIHVSQLANRFVSDAREIVKTGQIVKVKVLEVDVPRKRISLSMKLDAATGKTGKHDKSEPRENRYAPPPRGNKPGGRAPQAPSTAMASAFEKLKGLQTR